jgi:hypothetical protein
MWGCVYVNGKMGSVSGLKRPGRDAVFSPVSGVGGYERLEKYTQGAPKGMASRAADHRKIEIKKNAYFLHMILRNTFRDLPFSRNKLMTRTLDF